MKLQAYSAEFLAYEHLMMEQIVGRSRRTRRKIIRDMLDHYCVNQVDMALNVAGNTNRGPSSVIWSDCPWPEYVMDPSKGQTFWDDFNMSSSAIASNTGTVGNWSVYASTGAQINDAQLEGGVIKIGTDGDDESVAILAQGASFRFITTSTLAYNQKMWYESRWARSSITTDIADHFVGLMKPTLSSGLPVVAQPITTTDDTLMTAGDLFGFHSNSNTATRGGPTEIAAAFVLASGTVNYPTNLTTLMATTGSTVLAGNAMVKTGFVFDAFGSPFKRITSATARQTAGQVVKAMIRFFINGLELPTFLSSADVSNATSGQAFPTAFLSPVFAVGNTSGSATNTLNIDYVRVAQKANS